MEFQDVVNRRRMIRDFTSAPIDPSLVDRALTNATHAPSAGFSQGWGFLVLDSPDDVHLWWSVTTTEESLNDPDPWLAGMMRAPVVIVPCSNKQAYLSRYAETDKRHVAHDEGRWSMPFWHMDTAMASLLILQTATDTGLGACFFGIPLEKVDAVRSEFAVPSTFEPIGAIAMGHRTSSTGNPGSPSRRARRSLTDVVHRSRWTTS